MRYLLIILLIFSSCKTSKIKETSVEVEKKSISYALPTNNILEVDNICDTLKPSPTISQTLHTGSGEVKVNIKDNKLIIETKTDTILKEKIVYRDKIVTKEEKQTVFKWAKITWFFLGLIILGAFFPIIFTVINGLLRKLFFLIFKIPI